MGKSLGDEFCRRVTTGEKQRWRELEHSRGTGGKVKKIHVELFLADVDNCCYLGSFESSQVIKLVWLARFFDGASVDKVRANKCVMQKVVGLSHFYRGFEEDELFEVNESKGAGVEPPNPAGLLCKYRVSLIVVYRTFVLPPLVYVKS